MSQTKIIISIIIAVIVVGGGVAAFKASSKDSSPEVSSHNTSSSSTETPAASGKKMAFSQFVKQGGSYKCTMSQFVGDQDTKGVTYIYKGMVKGEYVTTTQGKTFDTNFILRDGYTYTWTSMMPNLGFKGSVDGGALEGGDTNANMSGSYSFNMDKIGDYDCEEWTPDATKFSIPTTITFQEV